MSELFITWDSILPHLFFERTLIALTGIGMFAHFICMAAAAPVKSPHAVFVFLVAIVFSSVGMFFTAISGQVETMMVLLLSGISSMFLFWLWLWYKGMHVKDFLDKKYGH